ncbi:pyrroline-5-carboxylate reductase [Brevibacterium litoralis]|uniref:pyrroline-5-carboxylate reductase n=1 Tax=Brevibacterium litoralis TaxID=3138935 RepID=UPI0032EE2C86
MKIAFIGTGNMGGSLLRGVLAGEAGKRAQVVATTRSQSSAQALASDLDIRVLSQEEDPAANRAAATDADFVFLGVKPWMMADTLVELHDALREDAVVVSMAAGVSLDQLAAAAAGRRVVRIMPNTPSSIGLGVITLAAGGGVTEAEIAEISALLKGAGVVVPIPEAEIHASIAVAGSAVAYFFLVMESLVEAGVAQGLTREAATQMVVGTANGAGRLAAQNPDPVALRKAVTSKGGTTAAALGSLEDDDIRGLMARAAQAAVDRSKEMEAGN